MEQKVAGAVVLGMGERIAAILTANPPVAPQGNGPDRVQELRLIGGMMQYDRGSSAQHFDMNTPFEHSFDLRMGTAARPRTP